MGLTTYIATPPAVFAVAYAAHKSGDRELERAARNELRKRHGITVSFPRMLRARRIDPVTATYTTFDGKTTRTHTHKIYSEFV